MRGLAHSIVWAAVMGLVIAAAGLLWWSATGPPAQPPPERAAAAPLRLLEGLTAEDFAPIPAEWEFRFPADHGPHPAYRTEWWYLTGALHRPTGPRLGLQLVIARLALSPEPAERPSAWATSQIYLGLLTLSDPGGGEPLARVRTARAALGLAGAERGPVRIWLGEWRLRRDAGEDADAPGWDLQVLAEGLGLDLALQGSRAPILASALGERDSGRAPPFHLYVEPRLQAEGRLRADGDEWPLAGVVSLEHAWGELPLPGGPVARDRFALFLDDGRTLSCIRSHRTDGSGEPATSCLLAAGARSARLLSASEVRLEPTGHWTSPHTGARYPTGWTLRLPREDLDLQLMPESEDAEVALWAPVWAGPVQLRGTSAAGRIGGEGFMQLTGYDDS